MMRWLSISLFLGAVAICLYPAFGQERASAVSSNQGLKKKEAASDGGQEEFSSSIKSCQFCHQIGLDNVPGTFKENSLARFDESKIWSVNDIHSKSFKMLVDSKLGKQMNAILEPIYKKPVSNDKQCLACHSNKPEGHQGQIETEWAKEELGITCVVCHSHNPGQKLPGTYAHFPWLYAHFDDQYWREKNPIEKSGKGMKDLRSPEVKATLCASCHIGNAAEGKVVTHQMYAAGHPPLPPFEIVTFMNSQPSHWGHPSGVGYLNELAESNPGKCWELYHYRSPNKELANARNLAVSALVSFRTSMELIAHQSVHTEQTGLMDFAQFDCLACHHDLRIPSDRQSRGYVGSPGRPSLKAWSSLLPRIVIDHAAAVNNNADLKQLKNDFQAKCKALEDAVQSQPFGNPQKMKTTAEALVQWSNDALKALEDPKLRYTEPETKKLLKSIIENGNNHKLVTDPEAAWQIAWATDVLSKALPTKSPGSETDLLKKLDDILPLRIRTEPGSPSLTDNGQHTKRQNKLNDFSPKSFLEIFSELEKQK